MELGVHDSRFYGYPGLDTMARLKNRKKKFKPLDLDALDKAEQEAIEATGGWLAVKGKPHHDLILTGKLEAKCRCGDWEFMGVLAEAKQALKDLHREHVRMCRER